MSNQFEDADQLIADAVAWRRHLHQVPEILFDLPATSAFVADCLRSFGCDEVVTGIAQSGVVATIRGADGEGASIALRSDMDALMIEEASGVDWASGNRGKMHACGHDGHMAMLLGAARYLTLNRSFRGTVVLVFQPGEEGGHGCRRMIDEGVLDRFGIEECYGMHNLPGLPVGQFATRAGAMMAAGDRVLITLEAEGGHAASPQKTSDSILGAAHLVTALQSIVSRATDPFDPVVISVTHVASGSADALNVIPAFTKIGASVRTVAPETRQFVEQKIRQLVSATADLFDLASKIEWSRGYPVTATDPAMTQHVVSAASAVVGPAAVDASYPCIMGSEDFSYMLEKRPGGFVWLGNGETANLHQNTYDFNDAALSNGIAYWIELVRTRLG